MENFKYADLNRIDLKRKIIYFSVSFLILFFILILGYFLSALRPVSLASDIKQIEIKSGEGFQQISLDLKNAGIVRSSMAFQLISVISGSAHKLKPGLYFLESAWSAPNILRKIIIGPDLEKEVVIPEGLTFLDIDKKLSDVGIIQPKALANFNFDLIKGDYEFLKDLKSPIKIEGYLFPDTYKFFINSKPEDVAKKFLDNFNLKAWPVLKTYNLSPEGRQLSTYNLLNIASLIEREVYFNEEKPIVSGIIYKRLKIGMGLQIDASIIYGKCGGFILYCKDVNFYRKDTSFVSSYNTYLYNGLTPTPISNPGLDSINAALNPVNTDFLYYLSDPKTHRLIFSKTLEEHNKNRELYLGV
ncbi:MAG: endolytic transglycosylase MltG [Patescibacteria group bacterium]